MKEADSFNNCQPLFLDVYRSESKTTRGGECRQESCECGYYHLHPNLYEAITLHNLPSLNIERATHDGDRVGSRGPRNLLELLPDEFTIEDAKRVRKQQGLDAGRAARMIATWKARKYVFQISDFSFKKATKYIVK